MARRRGQRKGYVFEKSGAWIGQWREDAIDADGNAVRKKFAQRIGPATGKDALSKRQADRLFQEIILIKLDAVSLRPQSLMIVSDFIREKFEPEVVWTCKPSGKSHYKNMLPHVVKALGARRLRDITALDVQKLVRNKLEAGYSTQTATHVKNTVSAVFRHAKLTGHFVGENPASLFRMPEMQRRKPIALTFEQAKAVLAALKWPAYEMAFLSMVTSLNVAELCGLRWKWVNLSDQYVTVEGELLPPLTLGVRENYYRGEFCSLKTGARRRNVPLPDEAIAVLAGIREAGERSPDLPVFLSRNRTPVNELNISARVLRPLGKAMGIRLSWHVFRKSHATFAEQTGMPMSDRMAQMGHSRATMTQHYTASDIDRRRKGVSVIAERLIDRSGSVQ